MEIYFLLVVAFTVMYVTMHTNPFSAIPPHRTNARSARLILRKLLVLRKITKKPELHRRYKDNPIKVLSAALFAAV
jgi:hypothetical protein